VEPRDPRGLADALVHILTDDAARREMGATARKKAVDRFSWTRIAGIVRSIYKKNLRDVENGDRRR